MASASTPALSSASATVPGLDVRVVVAEDDAVTADVIGAMLCDLGAPDVRVVSSGMDALAALAERHAEDQVVFCDLRMPGMDGLELLRHLSTRKACFGVVLLSGEDERILATASELARARGIRVLGTLAKPVTVERLAETLADIAAVRGAHASVRPVRRGFQPTIDDLGRGIAAGELVVHYQPRVSAGTGTVRGVEGLVRWQHPEMGLVPPMAFVPLAEQAGLIDPLTKVVFEHAMRDLATWRQRGIDLVVSLNATIDTLARLDFADRLVELVEDRGMPMERIVVEVTESRLASQLDRVLETLVRLRLHRVGIAIDDFGTGYSTMEQLRRIPFTELKIDRAFVRGAQTDRAARAILESSAGLARQLGMTSVAEGVETEQDLSAVRRAGCDQVQGYLFAKPMPEADLLQWISARRPTVS